MKIKRLKIVWCWIRGHRLPENSECGWWICFRCGQGLSEWGEWSN